MSLIKATSKIFLGFLGLSGKWLEAGIQLEIADNELPLVAPYVTSGKVEVLEETTGKVATYSKNDVMLCPKGTEEDNAPYHNRGTETRASRCNHAHSSKNIIEALDAAAEPSTENPFATMADVPPAPPIEDGEYHLMITDGIATWVLIK